MFDSITSKLKRKKTSKKPVFVNHREHLFEIWSKILFSYVSLNVILVGLSVLMVVSVLNGQNIVSEEITTSDLISNSDIVSANQQLRYKTLLRSGLIDLPGIESL